ncbi:hypothetical protein ZIOFF_014184 [Zingiber officinale]|uniref:Uncharacterized protein n=1 Tax=Zingiber officinale TaxID=94328 RepID=A0A8J5LDH5_ZINOF|nr:hypothetical protein ZIOFF_014184 [Zingiber officinale]
MVIDRCLVCFLYVLVSTTTPRCPRCGAHASVHSKPIKRHKFDDSNRCLPQILSTPCSLVFGKRVVNDAIAVVLFNAIQNFILDPKRKVHKSVKGVLKLEVEKLHTSLVDVDNISDGGSIIIDSNDDGDRFTETSLRKYHSNGHDIPIIAMA